MFKIRFLLFITGAQRQGRFVYPALRSTTVKSAMQMGAWLLLLSLCSSWCTRRQWWKTRPPACLCWRFRLQIQTWELMARSPTPFTALTQTSSISTTGQVWWCVFGVKTQALPLSVSVWVIPSAAQRESLLKRAKNISTVFSFFLPGAPHWHPSHFISVITSFCPDFSATRSPVRYQFLSMLADRMSQVKSFRSAVSKATGLDSFLKMFYHLSILQFRFKSVFWAQHYGADWNMTSVGSQWMKS